MLRLVLIVVVWVTGGGSMCLGQTTAPREVDVRRASAAGIRLLEGRHVRLFTDLPSSAAIDELPQVFDAAVPEWAAYFDVPRNERRQWLAFLINDRERFAAVGLLPEDNPEFVNGYARGYELWLMEQPSDYYRRHLLLHEGTHAFMQTQLGGAGPGWYMEGMAELLGTHSWRGGRLKLGVMPASREDVPMWGRTKLVRDAVAARKAWPLEAVLKVDNRRVLRTDDYAWTWALATLLDGHPRYQKRFRGLKQFAADPDFDARFRESFAEDWRDLHAEWDAYVSTLDYGYDVARMAMTPVNAQPIEKSSKRVSIDASRGWQSTGWLLRGGETYRVTASGQFQIADDGQPWPCEAGGVTIGYHDGKPLGVLLGALREVGGDASGFAAPTMIGLRASLKPRRDAVLFLRINETPSKLRDNRGELNVRIEQFYD
jgi:hypothetical protein